jgi:hypothetical protein
MGAFRQHTFLLKISEMEYGKGDPRTLPALNEIARYLERHEDYQQAIKYLQTSVDIVEKHYGKDDLRLDEPLKKIGDIGMFDRNYRAKGKKALARRAKLMEDNDSADLREKILSLVHLGDIYAVAGDARHEELYHRAWQMMAGQSGYEALRDNTFGTPTRLVPRPGPYHVERFPDQPDELLYADLEFSVTEEGRLTDVGILETNVPRNRVSRLPRLMQQIFRYRPRIVEGQLVPTRGLNLRQQLMVQVTPKAKVNEVEIRTPGSNP